MKKIFALLPMIAAFALTGCGDNEKESEEQGTNLELSEDQAKAKVRELADTSGYEITFKYTSSDSESTELDVVTIGQKDGFTWVLHDSSKTMWKVDDTSYTTYSYDDENSKFVVAQTYTKEYLASLGLEDMNSLDVYGIYLYMGNMYDGLEGYHKVRDLTYVGRSATEYTLKETYASAYLEATVIIDKQTGVTLYWGVAGRSIDGDTGSASYQVTAFKTGAQVSVPRHD